MKLLLYFACSFLAFSDVAIAQRPDFVDLRSSQTPVRSQTRGNCFLYATVAAMEAAYKREGYGDLDLAEHFSDYVGRMMFLETCEMDGRFRTRQMRVPAAWERETGIPLFEKLSGTVDSLVTMSPATVLGIPLEEFMPYSDYLFDSGERDEADYYWQLQYNVSTYLLDEDRLPRLALQAPWYHRVKQVHWLTKSEAANPDAIESVLASGREVIWDFQVAGDCGGAMWKYAGPTREAIGHRMLIVGYDRRDPDNKYFIAKNSWGHPAANLPGDDFTYFNYEYLQYGEWASWIEVARPYQMPQLTFIGRWELAFGEYQGTLDIYHLPGLMQNLFEHDQYLDERGQTVKDRRLGTFYLDGDPEKPYRVNGTLFEDQIEAWIDFDQPTPRWDVLNGWRVVMKHYVSEDRMKGHARLASEAGTQAQAKRVVIRAPARPIEEQMIQVDTGQQHADSHPTEQQDHVAVPVSPPLVDPAAAENAIEAKWQVYGGVNFLGKAITGVETCPDGVGRYTHYEHGSIYWSPQTPASVIYGAIREKWATLGWETSSLGYPTSDEIDFGENGRANTFQHGRIVWFPEKGAWEYFDSAKEER